MQDNNDLIYSLWLNCICGHSPRKINECMKLGVSPKELFDGKADKGMLRTILKERYAEYTRRDLDGAKSIIDYCGKNGIRILNYNDEAYPELLRNIDTPPTVLYTKGDELDLNKYLTITVVGTRYGSDEGEDLTRRLGYELAADGAIVVSGMALKLDAAAHTGALLAGQKTVAVLAGGVDIVYPKANEYLYNQILKNGMIVSERPPEMSGRPEYYQERNRILAGLSYGVVVTEGMMRSGTLITAGYAERYNRDLFAVPGSPKSSKAQVPNGLLHEGAKLTLSSDDVINEYTSVYEELLENGRELLKSEPQAYEEIGDDIESFNIKKSNTVNRSKNQPRPHIKKTAEPAVRKKPDFEKFNGDERKILEYLYTCCKPVHIDEIIRETGFAAAQISGIILMLQLKGAIKQSMGNLYTLAI